MDVPDNADVDKRTPVLGERRVATPTRAVLEALYTSALESPVKTACVSGVV